MTQDQLRCKTPAGKIGHQVIYRIFQISFYDQLFYFIFCFLMINPLWPFSLLEHDLGAKPRNSFVIPRQINLCHSRVVEYGQRRG